MTIRVALALALAFLAAAQCAAQPAPTPPPPRFVKKQFRTVQGLRMAYVDVGKGPPILFLHGNPTSSYLWRNVLPYAASHGRLIAPDLPGMGDSAKLPPGDPQRYTFLRHFNYLSQLLEQLSVKRDVTLVLHDWGSALGFLWAYQRRFDAGAVRAIVFMEAIVAPYASFAALTSPPMIDFFRRMRSPEGELLLQNDQLLDALLPPNSVLRNLTGAERAEYRRPFLRRGEDRRPIVTWTRQFPIGGHPPDVVAVAAAYSAWLAVSPVRKLFIRSVPGLLLADGLPPTELVRSWPNVTEVVVQGLHFLQEDSPDDIGRAIADWL